MHPTADPLEDRIARLIEGIAPSESLGDLLLAIHRYQRDANPAYDRYCTALPTARTWREIPALPQQIFKHQPVRCFAAAETVRTFRTSGTTGEGWGEHHFQSLRLYRLAAIQGWKLAGLDGPNVLSLIPPASAAPFSSLSQMASWLAGDKAFFVHNGVPSWEKLHAHLTQCSEPPLLFGTALAFLNWFDALGDRRISVPTGTLAVETGGYKGTGRELTQSELHARFHDHLGLPPDAIFNEYGMTELSSQFYSRGANSPHFAPPWARGLVIDPETNAEVPDGATGVLRLFDAANLGSCCAIQTRDLAIRRGENFQLLGRDPTALPRGCSRAADEMLTPASGPI